MMDRRQRALVVGRNLPSIWRLQSVLLRAGFFPRAMQIDGTDDPGDEPTNLVLFDGDVRGAEALRVLGRLTPADGATDVPAIFLGGDRPDSATERSLPLGADDSAIRGAIADLTMQRPIPNPRSLGYGGESGLDLTAEDAAVLTPRRREARAPLAARTLVAALTIGTVIAAYSLGIAPWSADDRSNDAAALTTGAEPPAPTPTPAPTRPSPDPTAAVPPVVEATATAPGTPMLSALAVSDAETPTPRPPTRVVSPTMTAVPTAPPQRYGAIEGRITDALGAAAIPGAQVLILGSVRIETTTSGDGRYYVSDLPPGSYQVTAVAPGYVRAANRTAIVAAVTTTDNLALEPLAGRQPGAARSVTDARTGRLVPVYSYEVRPGDILADIASRIGATPEEILALNRLDPPGRLPVGLVLNLPASTFGEK